MDPDYTAMVSDFIRPAVSFFLFAFMVLGWAIAFQLMKEVTDLRMKLGREVHKESLKDLFIRKSALLIFPLYSFKNFIADIQLQSALRQLLRKKKRIWKLIFQLD